MKAVLVEGLARDFEPSVRAIRLDGFVENGVTYESHTFWLEIERTIRTARPDGVLYVRHGGGWQRLRLDDKITMAMTSLIALDRGREAFFLAWGLFDAVRDATATEWMRVAGAFVDGRLKKRRVRGGTRERPRYRVEVDVPGERVAEMPVTR